MAAPKAPVTPAAAAQQKTAATAPAATAPATAYAFELEDGIPLPPRKVGVKGQSTYPFAAMEIGQSFFVPVTETHKEPWKTVTSMASRHTRELFPKKFVTARMTKEIDGKPVDGVRVYREADNTEPLPAPVPRRKKADKAAAVAEQPAAEAQQLPAAA